MNIPELEIRDGKEIHTRKVGTLNMDFFKQSLGGPNIVDVLKERLKDEYKDWVVVSLIAEDGSSNHDILIVKVVNPTT
jgi:hypothetical protein